MVKLIKVLLITLIASFVCVIVYALIDIRQKEFDEIHQQVVSIEEWRGQFQYDVDNYLREMRERNRIKEAERQYNLTHKPIPIKKPIDSNFYYQRQILKELRELRKELDEEIIEDWKDSGVFKWDSIPEDTILIIPNGDMPYKYIFK